MRQHPRIRRCRLYPGAKSLGATSPPRSASSTVCGCIYARNGREGGKPVEFFLQAGATNDNLAFEGFELDLPEGSTIYADKQYNDYHYEDLMEEAASIEI